MGAIMGRKHNFYKSSLFYQPYLYQVLFFVIISFTVLPVVNAFDGTGVYQDGKKIMGFDITSLDESGSVIMLSDEFVKKENKKKTLSKHSGRTSFSKQKKYIETVFKCKELVNKLKEKVEQDEDTDEQLKLLIETRDELFEANLELIDKFNEINIRYQDKGCSQSILDKHILMVNQHKENFQELMEKLLNFKDSNKEEELEQNIYELNNFFSKKKYKKSRQFLHSQEEPVNIAEPEASAQDSDSDNFIFSTASEPTLEDLNPTIDIQITQEISELAESLDNSPLKIYEYLKNNFEFELYLGSRKGSSETLRHKSGNDYDLASLLIALLRTSGIPARYATGMVKIPVEQAKSWLGVENGSVAGHILTTIGMDGSNVTENDEVVFVKCRRVWVEAYIPYGNYRGNGIGDTSKMWIPMDPAFKQYDYQPGIDIPKEMGFDGKAFIDDYTSTFHEDSIGKLYKQQIMDYLAANYPELDYSDIYRIRTLRPENPGIIPGSLPYILLSRDNEYSEIPSDKRFQVKFHIHGQGSSLEHTVNLVDIAGKQVTISYTGATEADQEIIDEAGGVYEVTEPWLVSLKPVLKVDGCVVATGTGSVIMGMNQSSDMYFIQPTGAPESLPVAHNQITAGGYQGIGFNTSKVVRDIFTPRTTSCEEDYGASLLYGLAMKYLSGIEEANNEIAETMQIIDVHYVNEALVEHSINVTYNGEGTPITFEWTGLQIDADRIIHSSFSVTGEDKNENYRRMIGAQSSLWENLIFESEYEEEAVSTIKILALANDNDIPILTFDKDNASTIYSSLNLSSSVEEEIYSAVVDKGHVVTVPRDNITYHEWVGTGYIDMDPETFGAGYLISGGINGGATVKSWSMGNQSLLVSQYGCVNATINSLSPSAPDNIYFADNENYLEFDVTLSPVIWSSVNGCGDYSVSKKVTARLTIKELAEKYGGGKRIFTAGLAGNPEKNRCAGDCQEVAKKEYTIVTVEIKGPEKTIEGLDSEEFSLIVKPDDLAISEIKWEAEWPEGAGNEPSVKFSNVDGKKTIIEKARWFAEPDSEWYKWELNGQVNPKGATKYCEYKIFASIKVGGQTFKSKPFKWIVYVERFGYIEGYESYSYSEISSFKNDIKQHHDGSWFLNGKGGIIDTPDSLKAVVAQPTTRSQFYKKVLEHEEYHVTQFQSIEPWFSMWNVDKFYNETLSKLKLPKEKTFEDMEDLIEEKITDWETDQLIIYNKEYCNMELGAYTFERGVAPPYQHRDMDWILLKYKNVKGMCLNN
jgi:hypothetical protein